MTDRDQQFYHLSESQLNLNSPQKTYWGNLGLWSNTPEQDDYGQACTALAHKLAAFAQLKPTDSVIDVGFGCGDQLLLWLQHYQLVQLKGLNLSKLQTQLSQQRLRDAGFADQAAHLTTGSAEQLSYYYSDDTPAPNKILALDCAYHFKDKDAFFSQCQQLLCPRGLLCLNDLLLSTGALTWQQRLTLKFICKLCRIPYASLLTLQQYQLQVEKHGFEFSGYEDLTEQVFLPFGRWLEHYQQQHKDLNLRWTKYTATARFLNWASRHKVLSYHVIRLTKSDS